MTTDETQAALEGTLADLKSQADLAAFDLDNDGRPHADREPARFHTTEATGPEQEPTE